MTWAKGEYDSIHGKIVSNWRLEDGVLTLNITLPANTWATLYIPAADTKAVQESGQPAEDASGVRFLRMEPGAAVYEVGSGSYCFAVRGAG